MLAIPGLSEASSLGFLAFAEDHVVRLDPGTVLSKGREGDSVNSLVEPELTLSPQIITLPCRARGRQCWHQCKGNHRPWRGSRLEYCACHKRRERMWKREKNQTHSKSNSLKRFLPTNQPGIVIFSWAWTTVPSGWSSTFFLLVPWQ